MRPAVNNINMKLIVIVFAAVVAVSVAEQETFKIPQEIVDKIRKIAIPCADENKLDHSIILKLAEGTVPEDEPNSKFLYCFTKKSGYVTDDGHMVVDKLAQILKDHPLQDQFKQALTSCNEISKESPLATLMAMHKCFAERPPVRLLF